MGYEERIIAFVDILGFKAIVNGNNAEKVKEILTIPKNYFYNQPIKKYRNIQISLFSDSIIISFLYTEEHAVYNLLLDLQNILIEFIYKGVVCRGFIKKGNVYHDQNFLFGPAFNEAYDFEKKMKYPKIGFDNDIYTIGCKYHDPKKTERQEDIFLRTLFIKDNDNTYYIDYLFTPISSVRNVKTVYRKEYLLKLLEITNNGLMNLDPLIREKYEWVKLKFYSVLDSLLNFSDEMYNEIIKDISKKEIQEIRNKIL